MLTKITLAICRSLKNWAIIKAMNPLISAKLDVTHVP